MFDLNSDFFPLESSMFFDYTRKELSHKKFEQESGENLFDFFPKNSDYQKNLALENTKDLIKNLKDKKLNSIDSLDDKTSEEFDTTKLIDEIVKRLDQEFIDLRLIAQSLTSSHPPIIPDFNMEMEENEQLQEVFSQIEQLEKSISKKYSEEFIELSWHGRSSFQRILWQDEEFVKTMRDPVFVKALLLRAKEKKEQDIGIGEDNTISSLLLYGLASNRLSYLVTAAPNWFKTPTKKVHFNLSQMGEILRSSQLDQPKMISKEYFENLYESLRVANC